MEKRIKIFWDLEVEETKVNAWLASTGGKLHQFHFTAWPCSSASGSTYALVFLYTPEVRDEKEIEVSEKSLESDERVQQKLTSFWKQKGPYCDLSRPSYSNSPIGSSKTRRQSA